MLALLYARAQGLLPAGLTSHDAEILIFFHRAEAEAGSCSFCAGQSVSFRIWCLCGMTPPIPLWVHCNVELALPPQLWVQEVEYIIKRTFGMSPAQALGQEVSGAIAHTDVNG
ncbi:hypothetical protein B0H10DRAFT_2221736 [Mycena sp. CBHHK59/15]|nr:hypothetical protein B0H10DRAFT_2221736 [Mycena sp. CBHHK59/15]